MEQSLLYFLSISLFVHLLFQPLNCQQTYRSERELNCSQSSSASKFYRCNGTKSPCHSFITFISEPPYDSPLSIAYLLGSEASRVALINNMSSEIGKIPSGKLVIAPVSCSCSGNTYQHNTLYTTKKNNETYFSVANNTYQGLTTCQALKGQNHSDEQILNPGSELMVPTRCACPSANQTANGVSFLLAYMVKSDDTIASIGNYFGVDEQSILEANLLQESEIYPFTPLLVPLKSESCSTHPELFFCHCPTDGSGEYLNCKSDGNKFPVKLVALLVSGIGISIGFLCMFISGYQLCKFIRKRRSRLQREKLFKANGGFMLQQQLSSHGRTEQAKIFTAEELQNATDNYNQSRFLGQGGFGTVYKGMLPNGKIVAVKRSKAIDRSQVEQFINEVVILSQINHRNIVKLLGCCLETEVPVLVYEFIPNGTLSQHIHDYHQGQDQEPSLSWDHRVKIACEVAGAVAYMHSAASFPIFHRDIKSSNILLDDKFNAKVSDFGTSRSIPNDQTHLTTAVRGTFGYLDPEYFQSGQFSEKSDVYSFGVVLVELLTGKKPHYIPGGEDEERNLVSYFISLAKENQLLEILDPRVAKEASKQEIKTIAELALRCLRSNGKNRPAMKEVAIELEGFRKSQTCLEIYQEPQLLSDEPAYVHNPEVTRQGSNSNAGVTREGSISSSTVFPLEMELPSF